MNENSVFHIQKLLPIVFAGSIMILLILAPFFALSIKNHNLLKEEITSLKEEVTSLKGDMTSLKKDIDLMERRCPEGWHKISSSNCYFFFANKQLNFYQAKDLCREKDATIFEPRDQLINNMVYEFAKTVFGSSGDWAYFIGMVKIWGSNNWKWVKDNSPVSVYNWNKGLKGYNDQPNGDGDCARVMNNPSAAKWWDGDCSSYHYSVDHFHVICEKSVY